MSRILGTLKRVVLVSLCLAVAAALLGSSSVPMTDPEEQVRAFTRSIEFDFVTWTLNALSLKVEQAALGTSHYLTPDEQKKVVLQYVGLITHIQNVQDKLNEIYADPNISDPQLQAAPFRAQLTDLTNQRDLIGPLAEGILQHQISSVAAEMGVTLGGQPLPPVLYHSSALPMALIVSPRNVIQQDQDISLLPDLSVDEQVKLENEVDKSLNVSSLVVPIGGVGLYPTMVMQTTDINWLMETVAHEWTHNYLTWHPLGASYMNSPELRTMNETTASISGKEIGAAVIAQFYPEFVPPPPQPPAPASPSKPPAFNFNAVMHTTRVQVDKLLAAGKITEAETYMESQRRVFWDNGYRIRKLNQAYFAFYGAYADIPEGAAGEDPVGAAVRTLRADSPSLAAFLNRMAWFSSYQQLKQATGQLGSK
jgi:hypothetical protein